MIDDYAPAAQADEARLVLRPNHSLSRPHLRIVIVLLALLVVGVSALGWWQGNVFAPLFAVLQVGFLAACLVWVFRRSQRAEVVVVSRTRMRVCDLPELNERFVAHPARVRLDTAAGHVRLHDGMQQAEVGECLNAAERATLAIRLAELLRWARS